MKNNSHLLHYGFMGSGKFAAACLEELCLFYPPAWIVCAPPRPAGRGLRLTENPVSKMSEKLGIVPILLSNASDDPALQEILLRDPPDIILVVDFAQKIKNTLLSLPLYGCLNIHPSMLPIYRGSAPIQRALMAGYQQTGVTVFRLVEKMDAGPVLLQEKIEITREDTTGTLLIRGARLGVSLLKKQMNTMPVSQWKFQDQDESQATYAPKIAKEERLIDWKWNAERIDCYVRALSPEPGGYILYRGKRLGLAKVLPVAGEAPPGTVLCTQKGYPIIACGEGALMLQEVQPEGKNEQSGAQWFCGSRLKVGDRVVP